MTWGHLKNLFFRNWKEKLLAVVLGLYSRRVMGWTMQSRPDHRCGPAGAAHGGMAAQTQASGADPLGSGLAVHQHGLGCVHPSSQS